MKRIKDTIKDFEFVEEAAHEKEYLFLAFLKEGKCHIRYYEEPTSEEYALSIVNYYILFGMPEIVEVYSTGYLLNKEKCKKRYGNMSTMKAYEKIIKKYGSLGNSPFSKEVKQTRVYTEQSCVCFIDNEFVSEMFDNERAVVNCSVNYKDPFFIINHVKEQYETDAEYKMHFDCFSREVKERNKEAFVSTDTFMKYNK